MDNPYFLALDYGTQSVRALVFDVKGSLIAKAQRPIEPYRAGENGSAEQDPQYCYRQLIEVTRSLFSQSQVSPSQISGLAITSQRACSLLFDEQSKPSSPIYMWSDRRLATGRLPQMSWYYRCGFFLLGLSKRIGYLRRAAKVNFLHQAHKKQLLQANKVGMFSGYLISKVSGRLVDSTASQVGYLPFDYRLKQWAGPRSWRWQALACKPEQMVKLLAPGSLIGSICAHFAEDTGLDKELPLYAAGADKACEVYATGSGIEGIANVSLGSAAIVSIGLGQYREAYRYMPAFPSLAASEYNTEIQLERGFWLLSWLIGEFGVKESIEAEKLGISPEALISRLIENIPIGSQGLTLSPTWAQGVIFPGPEARGTIAGFSPEHTRIHLYRATIEGILLSLKAGLERLARLSDVPFKCVRISGGGAQSDTVMQMVADIFALPVERIHVTEASGLGAAMCCAYGAGYYDSLEQARLQMSRVGQRFEPLKASALQYQAVYQAHRRLYPQIKPFNIRLSKIKYPTG